MIPIRLLEPAHGSVDVPILEEPLREFIKKGFDYSVFDSMEGDQYFPRFIPFRWEGEGESFTLHIATQEDFSDAVRCPVVGTECRVHWLVGDQTYFWKVTSEAGESEVFCLRTEDTPRTVWIDGAHNTRDFGGWKTADGRCLRRGRVYRTSVLRDVTEEGRRHCLDTLGIRWELDLRPTGESDAGQGSPLGEAVQYQNYGAPAYYNYFLPEVKERLKNIFLFFTDPTHYPMAFHCLMGRDRTGSLAFMLLMLCGVSYEDARRDYDITFFTERYRHCESSHKTIHETHFNPFVEQLRAYGTGTLAENVEAFILDLGLTKEDIEAIRRLLTEEVF